MRIYFTLSNNHDGPGTDRLDKALSFVKLHTDGIVYEYGLDTFSLKGFWGKESRLLNSEKKK